MLCTYLIGVPFKAACDLVGLAGEVVGQNAAGEVFLVGDARSDHQLNSILLTFQNQGSLYKKCVFNKRSIKVCVSCF